MRQNYRSSNRYSSSSSRSNRFGRRRFKPRFKVKDAFDAKYPRNYDIKADKVRVISSDGKNLGVMSLEEGIKIANEQEMDLVLTVPQAKPPVCKVVNWESFKYHIQKIEKERKKKGKALKIKEIKFSPKIADGDLERKLDNIKKFFKKGHQVKVTIMRRRRVTNEQLSSFQEKVLTLLREYSNILNVQNKGRNIYILLKAKENAKAEDTKNSIEKDAN